MKRIWLLIGVLAALVFAACDTTAAIEQPTEEPTAEPTETPVVENAITVEDQDVADEGTVTVANVSAAQDGWVVIQADDGSIPGAVLGWAQVEAGQSEDVTVTIEPRLATPTLYATLHIDAGEAGVYEFPGADEPAETADGDVVEVPFAATDIEVEETE